MKTQDAFWIFLHCGLGDAIVANALLRHYAEKYKDRYVILPCWERNLASIQWMLSDVPNIFFYPIEQESQLLTCQREIKLEDQLGLGWYAAQYHAEHAVGFNPILWDSEFYRQAGLDPELKWKGFKLPETGFDKSGDHWNVVHQDQERGFCIREDLIPKEKIFLSKESSLAVSAINLMMANEIHCIDSSMLNLADLMETPYCKRFVFHRYARKGLPPQLRKPWEIID